MKLEINDSEIIQHWNALTTEKNEIDIRINGKKIFIGKIDNICSDIETITEVEDYLLGYNREIKPIKLNKINFIINATKQE